MSLIGLLHGLQHRLVHPEADGGREGGQGQVGSHADHTELGQGEEEQEHAAEHGSGLLDIPPVEQVDRCGGEEEWRLAVRLLATPEPSLTLCTRGRIPLLRVGGWGSASGGHVRMLRATLGTCGSNNWKLFTRGPRPRRASTRHVIRR